MVCQIGSQTSYPNGSNWTQLMGDRWLLLLYLIIYITSAVCQAFQVGGRWSQGSNHRLHIKEAVATFLETRVRRTLFSPYWATEIILLFILCVCEIVRKLVKFEVRPILTCLFIAGVLIWFLLPAADGLTKTPFCMKFNCKD